MGQILRAMTYDRDTEDGVEALTLNNAPLVWTHLDDGIMGGKSSTRLELIADDHKLHFQGTIDTSASVGWASARARLEKGLPASTEALSVKAQGDGKTYKVILMDANHDRRDNSSPLWEINLPTKTGQTETSTLPLKDFKPSFMARQLTPEEQKNHTLNPADLSKIGFMLSSRLSDGSMNPTETYGEGIFGFSLHVESVEAVLGKEACK